MKSESLQPVPLPLHDATTAAFPAASASGATSASANASHANPNKDTAKVAKEFESIFLRKMLSGLEKTATVSGKSSGGEMYGQMITDAFADAISKAGGIGLAKSIEEHMNGKKR